MYQETQNNYLSENERGLLISKFKAYGREIFKVGEKVEINFIDSIKETSKFMSFNLPSEICEVFIEMDNATIYWVYDSPLTQYIEEFIRFNLSESIGEQFKLIKDFYAKWTIIKFESEKKYYSSSLIKIIEKYQSKNNFLYKILLGVLYAYEQSCYDPEKSFLMYNEAIEVVNSLNMDEKFRNELVYLINIYIGFLHFKTGNYPDASERFNKALIAKNNGINAKFYLALTEVKLRNLLIASSLVHEIVAYDLTRAEYAIQCKSLVMFNYLNYNNFTKNIFHYDQFCELFIELEGYFNNLVDKDKDNSSKLSMLLNTFNSLKMNDYYTEEINKKLAFVTKFENNGDKSFILNSISIKHVINLLISAINDIIEIINKKYLSGIEEKLQIYNTQIEELKEKKIKTESEIESGKENLKVKLNASLKNLEQQIVGEIQTLENAITNLPYDKSTDPKNAFAAAMSYNFVFASLVFLLGGSAEFTTSNLTRDNSIFNEILGDIVLTGLKWASVGFLLGFIVSLLIAGTTIIERANKKQRLIQKISFLKNYKEKQAEKLKQEKIVKEKNILEAIKAKIQKYEERIEELLTERKEIEDSLRQDIAMKIEEESKPLKDALTIVAVHSNP